MTDYVCPIGIDLNLLTAQRRRIGRDDRIGTRDIFYPKQRRYQAALHPFFVVQCHCRDSLSCFQKRCFSYIYIQWIYLAISDFWSHSYNTINIKMKPYK